MTAYLAHTRNIAEATPASRNRIIDFWRALAILFVVFGHWLAASIWLRADGEITLMNSLEWIPYSGWLTWIVQVMPIFFFVGGYANARALRKVESGDQQRREWITTRVRRLYTPVIPLLIVWTLLIVVMRPFVPAEVIRAGSMSATVPLWFIAVYIGLVAVAPFTYRWWQTSGWVSVLTLAGAAVAVDIARFVFEVPGIGWANFVFVWAAVHQLGYWWASRDGTDPIPSATGWGIFAASLTLLIALTWVGWYPVAMIGIPGAELTNMTPPTFAIFLLGLTQVGLILGTQRPVTQLTQRSGLWRAVVAISGVIMTVYLWHLSAMTIVAAIGLFTFGGAAFEIEPGTWAWVLTRPIWIALLVGVLGLLVAVFARFEWRISTEPAPTHRRWVTLGVLLTAGSAAAVSYFGLATEDAAINWIIPAAAIVGAVMMGAMPRLRKTREKGGV
jgi:surface polysaccharide O-acyltransferase-like enzyme